MPWGYLQRHLNLALPMGFQSSIIAIGSLILQYALNGFGTTAVAAYTAAQKIDSIATMPMCSGFIELAMRAIGALVFSCFSDRADILGGVILIFIGLEIFLKGVF